MKSRVWIGVCVLAVVCATMVLGQQNDDAVKQIILGQIAWINSMVGQGKMSQADAKAQINKLKIQYADIVLGTETTADSAAASHVAAEPATTAASSRSARPVSTWPQPAASEASQAGAPAGAPATSHSAPTANQQQGAHSTPSGGGASLTHDPTDMAVGAAQPEQRNHRGASDPSQGDSASANDQTAAKACPSGTIRTDLAVPTLKVASTSSITGSVDKVNGSYPSGWVQLCGDGKLVGKAVAVSTKDGSFSVPATGDTLPALNNGDEITAQFYTGTQDKPTDYGDVSPALMVGSCKAQASSDAAPTFKRGLDNTGKTAYTGTVTAGEAADTVRICKNDVEFVPSVAITKQSDGTGTFDATSNVTKAEAGDTLTAQVVSGSGGTKQYSKVSGIAMVGSCSAVESGNSSTKPTLNAIWQGNDSFSGTLPGGSAGTVVRICVGDVPVTTAIVKDDGTFSGVYTSTFRGGQSVTAQEVTSPSGDPSEKYGLVGPAQTVNGFMYSTRVYSRFITGVEQSGFSSQGSNTNAFLEAEFRGPYVNGSNPSNQLGLTAWGRIRLLGGPLPSGTSVVAAVTNPSGTITTSNLTNVGQVVDYVFGPELRIHQKDHANGNTDRVSLIGGVGATTPLTAGGIQYSLTAPTNNSQQCVQLLNDSPYSYLFTNIATGTNTCIVGDRNTKAQVKTLSFSPVDRSNFLIKYGAGLRLTHIYPAKNGQAPYSGSIDFLVGQDQEITGGKFNGVVFGINGVYPLALGSSSFLYLFGSASMKTTGNGPYYPPLVLGTASAPMTPLPTSVEVVPIKQPNRDFYRFGVGVNLISLICSATKNCNSSTGSGGANGNSATNANANATGGNGNGGSNGDGSPTTPANGSGGKNGQKQKNPPAN